MLCTLEKDTEDLRMALHNQLERKLSHETPCQSDELSYSWCDGELHWVSIGWGPGIRRDRWLTEYIKEKCPDALAAQRDDFIGRHSDMECTFANYVVVDENRDSYTKIKKWRKTDMRTLIIHGAPGRGKTHLAKAVQVEFLRDMMNTAFITASALYELFIKAQPAPREYDLESMQQLADIRTADLFILDDLGSERQTSPAFFHEKLQQLLDEKHGRMIITSNFTPHDMEERYNSKIMSRILEKHLAVPLRGKDYRRGR